MSRGRQRCYSDKAFTYRDRVIERGVAEAVD